MITKKELSSIRVAKNVTRNIPNSNSVLLNDLLKAYDYYYDEDSDKIDYLSATSTNAGLCNDLVSLTGSVSQDIVTLNSTVSPSFLNKTIVLENSSEINYNIIATVANIAQRDATAAVSGDYIKVLDSSSDPRYPQLSGIQYFRRASSTWQHTKRYESIVAEVIEIKSENTLKITRSITSSPPSIKIQIGTDNTAKFQDLVTKALKENKSIYFPKGDYLFILSEITKNITCTLNSSSNLKIVGEGINTTKLTFIREEEVPSTGQLYVAFAVFGQSATSDIFNFEMSDLSLIGDGTNHKDKELQPSLTAFYWFDGQGKATLKDINITNFTNGVLTTGSCSGLCNQDRLVVLKNVTIDNILGVGAGTFGIINTMHILDSFLKNIGTSSIDTLLNTEYGQGTYFHRNSTTLFHNTSFDNVKSYSIVYFSSGESSTAKYQIISSCYFKNSPSGVSTDDRYHQTKITNCVFDGSRVILGASAQIADCTFSPNTQAAIIISSTTSPDKPVRITIDNCYFFGQVSYAIYFQNTVTQAPFTVINNCMFNTTNGSTLTCLGSGTVLVQNSLFTGTCSRAIIADQTAKVIAKNNYFNASASDALIKILSTSSFNGSGNIFETCSLTASGTAAGELYDSTFIAAPSITNTNPSFKVTSKVFTNGTSSIAYP
jgi:hypothetical protein